MAAPTFSRRQSHLVVAAVAAGTALACVLYLGGLLQSVQVARAQTLGVLHATGTLQVTSAGRVALSTHELWFDPVTLDTRYTSGDAGGGQVTRLRQGRTAVTVFHDRNQVIANTATSAQSPMLDVANRLLGYAAALQRQQLRVVQEGSQAGRPALLVYGRSSDMQLDGWLDRETLLPLDEAFLDMSGTAVVERAQWSYTVLEQLPREQVPAEVFTLPLPSNAASVISRYITAGEAAAFRGFDIYYLGPQFDGLPIFAITHRTISGAGPLQVGVEAANVAITYLRGDRKISLDQHPVAQHRARDGAPGIATSGEPVEVNGQRAVIYSYSGGADLEIQLGATVVTIFGANRQEVLKAAAELQKLN